MPEPIRPQEKSKIKNPYAAPGAGNKSLGNKIVIKQPQAPVKKPAAKAAAPKAKAPAAAAVPAVAPSYDPRTFKPKELSMEGSAQAEAFDASKYAFDPKSLPDSSQANTAINRRFDLLRQKQEQSANEQMLSASEGLARSAAARGRLGSGSFNKQQFQQQKELSGVKDAAVADVESQRELSLADQQNQNAQREFAARQEALGREFQAREASTQRGFASQEAVKQRNMDRESANRDQAFRAQIYNNDNAQFMENMAFEKRKFDLDEKVTNFNMKMAKKAAGGGHRDALQRYGDFIGSMGGGDGSDRGEIIRRSAPGGQIATGRL